MPSVAVVRAGQPLHFKSPNPILHRVHGLPKENREFNLGMPPTVSQQTVRLNRPERPFLVKCGVHPWERTTSGS